MINEVPYLILGIAIGMWLVYFAEWLKKIGLIEKDDKEEY